MPKNDAYKWLWVSVLTICITSCTQATPPTTQPTNPTQPVCSGELRIEVLPSDHLTLRVGERVSPHVRYTTCGGEKELDVRLVFENKSPEVISVTTSTGEITGKAVGEGLVTFADVDYGDSGTIYVMVK